MLGIDMILLAMFIVGACSALGVFAVIDNRRRIHALEQEVYQLKKK